MRSFPIVCSVLLLCGVFTTNGESVSNSPNVVIDGYTVNSTLNSPATLPLGTTVILVCRISRIPHGLQTNYHWTYPNEPCQQTGYAGRKINNNIIAINITSTSDGGTYACNVTAEGMDASQQFQLNVNGGQVVHSYGRLILNERVITDKQQLQPPNNDSGDGRIECRVSSGGARFSYHGRPIAYNTSGDVHEIRNGSTTTLVMRDKVFNNFVNFEGNCDRSIFHYLFLSNGTLPNVSITGTTSTNTSITVNIGMISNSSGIERVIIGYHRLDLGLPVVGEYVNNGKRESRTFSSLVPGAKYRITAWGLGGGDDRRISKSPAVREVTTMEQTPSPPRHLTRTRVFDGGIELNWIPPREPNGDIQHYIIKYTTQNGTQQEINTTNNTNYYNLTGLERGQKTYNIRVEAVNSAGRGGGMSRPDGFELLCYLSPNQQKFIKYNVPEVKGEEKNTYVAVAEVADSKTADVYVNGLFGQGEMKGTTDESTFEDISWYQKTLVFIEQVSGSDLQYQTYTPMIESNLGMMSDGENNGENNVVFKKLESGSNGITSIFVPDGDTYLWETTDNTYLSLHIDTGNMKFTQAKSSGSRFRFIEPPRDWEEEDQSDEKSSEQEVCKQEAGEQEADRQRKICKVQ